MVSIAGRRFLKPIKASFDAIAPCYSPSSSHSVYPCKGFVFLFLFFFFELYVFFDIKSVWFLRKWKKIKTLDLTTSMLDS